MKILIIVSIEYTGKESWNKCNGYTRTWYRLKPLKKMDKIKSNSQFERLNYHFICNECHKDRLSEFLAHIEQDHFYGIAQFQIRYCVL